jgi:hypothetical protein
MAGSNSRWKKGLFPIDEALLERLLDCCDRAQAEDEEAPEDGDCDDDVDLGALVWYLEENQQNAQAGDNAPLDPIYAADAAHAMNMRVLDDYLRRRLIDEPDPVLRTLH